MPPSTHRIRLEFLEDRSVPCVAELFWAYQAAIAAQGAQMPALPTPVVTTAPAPVAAAVAATPAVPLSPAPPAAGTSRLSGTVFSDRDQDGVRDVGEAGVAGARVYLDLNKDGQWNATEPSQRTGITGAYTFTGLAPGSYTVRELTPTGWQGTTPTARTVQVPASGPATVTANFGNARIPVGMSVLPAPTASPILTPPPAVG
jgi:hypothetical protein